MKLLADENIHAHIVRWLRSIGHDVVWVTESYRGESDDVLLQKAIDEERIVLSSDLDFGDLIYHRHQHATGVVLMRMDDLPIADRIARLQAVWAIIEANPKGKYIVITGKKIRVRDLPHV